MRLARKKMLLFRFMALPVILFCIGSCDKKNNGGETPGGPNDPVDFPAFITLVNDYLDIRIDGIPEISGDTYQLKISGAVNSPATFSLEELRNLELVERSLTVECIENPANGDLLGTVTWKGFNLYALLDGLGIKEGTSTVKYTCADGYYTYNTLEELQNNGVLGALYINGESIPPKYGYPLRIIFPGYYGVRQPGWIVEIELMEEEVEDYWSATGWHTDSSMAIDSKIFFPADNYSLSLGESVNIGGAAFGSRRVASVELTADGGASWYPTTIQQKLDQDFVWIFWEASFTPASAGTFTIQARATGMDGRVQPAIDNEYLDGTNSWPAITINVVDGE